MFEPALDAVTVGKAIREIRRQKKRSQAVVRGLAGIGRTHLSAIENGERKPTLETLYKIACAMNVKMSDIVILIEAKLDSNPRY